MRDLGNLKVVKVTSGVLGFFIELVYIADIEVKEDFAKLVRVCLGFLQACRPGDPMFSTP